MNVMKMLSEKNEKKKKHALRRNLSASGKRRQKTSSNKGMTSDGSVDSA